MTKNSTTKSCGGCCSQSTKPRGCDKANLEMSLKDEAGSTKSLSHQKSSSSSGQKGKK